MMSFTSRARIRRPDGERVAPRPGRLAASVQEEKQRQQGAPGQQDLQHEVRTQPASQLPGHSHAPHNELHARLLDRIVVAYSIRRTRALEFDKGSADRSATGPGALSEPLARV